MWTRQSTDVQGSIQSCSKSLSDRTLPFLDYQVMKAGWCESPCLHPPESIRGFAELPGPGLRAERSFVLCLFTLHSAELRGTSKQTKPKPFYSDNPAPIKTSISPAQVQQRLLFFLISRICLTKYCCLLSSPPSLEQLLRAFAMQLGP